MAAGDPSEEHTLPVGTVTFLLTDVEGSSAQWEAAPEAMAAAIPRHYDVLGDAIARWRGVRPLEQGEGDSVVAAFARASDAVAAALDAQRGLAAAPWPDGLTLRVRMAVHSGEAEPRDGRNYFGQAIVRCARLREIAHGGQVVVSTSTFDLVRDRLPPGAALADMGLHRLRDLGRPERVFVLSHADLPNDFPPLRSLDALPNNLPVQLTGFIGRTPEIADVTRLLGQSRLLTLTGAGGSGKTRLALQVAAERLPSEPDGAWWVDLARVAEPAAVVDAVLRSLAVGEVPGRAAVETLTRHLAERQLLLVLDNCEHVLDTVSSLVEPVLRSCPAVTVLATSREPLRVPGETTWPVPSLSFPTTAGAEPVESLDRYDAVRLFVDRARRVRPDFHLDDTNGPAVAQISRRLDGIPLALELAASWVRTLSPERISRALDDRFRLLAVGSRTTAPRQQTLRASVEWSHAALSEPEQVLFRRLAVFTGGFDLDAAESVASVDPIEQPDVLELLSRLVDKSLVQCEERAGDLRYRLLETLRVYGLERLQQAGEDEELRLRHLDHFLALAERLEQGATDARPEALDRLEADADNLRAAIETALARGHIERALRLAHALTFFWAQHGHFCEGRTTFARVLEASAASSPELRAAAQWGYSYLAAYAGDYVTATKVGNEALALARTSDDPGAAARPLHTLALVQMVYNPAAARPQAKEAIDLARRTGDEWCEADAMQVYAFTYVSLDDHDAARPTLDAAYEIATRRGNLFQESAHWVALAWADVRGGHFDDGRRRAQRAREQAEAVGDPMFAAQAIGYLVEALMETGDRDEARRLLDERLDAARESGIAYPPARYLHLVGRIELAIGRFDEARQAAEEALEWIGGEDIVPTPWFRLTLAEALHRLGETEACGAQLDAGMASALRTGQRWTANEGRRVSAMVALSRGEPEAAERLLQEALSSAAADRFVPQAIDVLEAMAPVASAEGAHRDAVRLLGAGRRARADIGSVRSPVGEADDAAVLTAARDALGPQFEPAWKEGAALPFADAVAWVSRARGERKRPSTGWASLTPTELQVVRLVAEGLTNREIGTKAFMSLSTVKTHLEHVFEKLGVTTRSELAGMAGRRGI